MSTNKPCFGLVILERASVICHKLGIILWYSNIYHNWVLSQNNCKPVLYINIHLYENNASDCTGMRFFHRIVHLFYKRHEIRNWKYSWPLLLMPCLSSPDNISATKSTMKTPTCFQKNAFSLKFFIHRILINVFNIYAV